MFSEDIDVKLTKQQKAHLRMKLSKAKKAAAEKEAAILEQEKLAKENEVKNLVVDKEESEDLDVLESNKADAVILKAEGLSIPVAILGSGMDSADEDYEFVLVGAESLGSS